MATQLKILGQSAPAATTITTLYTTPTDTSAVSSSITVCNQSAVATSFRVAIIPSGESLSSEHYIYYDVAIPGNDTFIATVGITLSEGDIVKVYATLATLSFSIFGQETT